MIKLTLELKIRKKDRKWIKAELKELIHCLNDPSYRQPDFKKPIKSYKLVRSF